MKHPDAKSTVLELSRDVPKNESLIKTLIGFCNNRGGKLVVGVSENRDILGVSEDEAASAIESLGGIVYKASSPPIAPLIYIQRIADKTLLIIEVLRGIHKPYYHKPEGLEKGTYIRLGTSTIKASPEIIEELKWEARGKCYDTLPIYEAKETDLQTDAIQNFIQERRKRKNEKITKELLLSYYLIHPEHTTTYATVASLLLFGKQPQLFFPEAFIICTHFKGREGRDAIASIDCTGDLFKQYNDAFNFIVDRLSYSFSIKDSKRQETLEIPEEAIREALINAIVHRNYHITSSVKVSIYTDRIEFFSPGAFITCLNIDNLKSGISFIRNIAICKVFREAGYIEKLGSGWPTIFSSYEARNLKPPKLLEGENFIKCILPRELADKEEDSSILDLFYTLSQINISDVMHHLKTSRTTAGRVLSELVSQGKIKQRGKGRGTYYTIE